MARVKKTKVTKPKPASRQVKEVRAAYKTTTPRIIKTDHPHIIRIKGVRGGDPITREAGVSVRAIVEITYRLKQTPEEIVESYRPMTLAEVYDALSYYHDHKEEIDQIIKENDEGLERVRLMTEEQDRQRPPRPPLTTLHHA
jgi:uncharacterized protein (DUF433 family)